MLAQQRAGEGGGCVGGGCGHRHLPRTGLGSVPSQVVEARLDNLCVCRQHLCMVKYHPGYWCITAFITPHLGPCNSWCYRRHCSFLAPCIRARGSKEYVRAILAIVFIVWLWGLSHLPSCLKIIPYRLDWWFLEIVCFPFCNNYGFTMCLQSSRKLYN